MNSKIYLGYVDHERYQPVSHTFKYPIYFYGLDLDELDHLDQKLFLFGYNRLRPASIHDSDYLDDTPGSIKDKLLQMLQEQKPSLSVASVFMITSMRYLNYAFNPVSFYYCFDDNHHVAAMVVEVNNTFGERHIYIPENKSLNSESVENTIYSAKKAFHVSPFNNLEGDYEFFFSTPNNEPGNKIDIRIDLIRDNDKAFSAKLCGKPLELTSANLLKMMIRHPIVPHLTKPRIFMEAARLYFSKHLKYHDKPEPVSLMTIKRIP
jgi:cyclopropane-fatty-acyl-phospholipid synthase